MNRMIGATMMLAAALLAVCNAAASPVQWVLEGSAQICGFTPAGLARLNVPMPRGSQILAAEIESKTVVIHYAGNPYAPITWRGIELTSGVVPVAVDLSRHIDQVRWLGRAWHIWDLGEFFRPIRTVPPGCGSNLK